MKNKLIILIIASVFATFTLNAQIEREYQITTNKNSKYGIIHKGYNTDGSKFIKEVVEHKYDSIFFHFLNLTLYNWPMITRIGNKYGMILHYKLGVLDDYRDSFVIIPTIYDTAYFTVRVGGYRTETNSIILGKNNKYGYMRFVRSNTVGFIHFSETHYFNDGFYISPIEFDLPPDGNIIDNNLLYKDGKCGYIGFGDNNIPPIYDTLIYLRSKNTTGICTNYSKFRWVTTSNIKTWKTRNGTTHQVYFIRATKGDKFTYFIVNEKRNEYDIFRYRQVIPWYSHNVDVKITRNMGTIDVRAFFLITEPNKASYLINPYDNNHNHIKMLNLDKSTFRMDSIFKYYYCDIDTLTSIYSMSPFPYTYTFAKQINNTLANEANRTWLDFKKATPRTYRKGPNSNLYIIKNRNKDTAFVYRNVCKYFKTPYNPCGTDLFMICTEEYNHNKDSVKFILYNSQTNDTIYQGKFPYNAKLEDCQLYIKYPIYGNRKIRFAYYKYPSIKAEIDNQGLNLKLYYIPAEDFDDIDEFKKSKNKKYYYKLGVINTCEMKFYPNKYKFLERKPFMFGESY